MRERSADARREQPLPPAARRWGNVARRGAREVARSGDDEQGGRRRPTAPHGPTAPPPPADVWVRDDAPRRASGPSRAAGADGARPARPVPRLPADVATEIRRAAETATARRREALVDRMEKAVVAYERGRFQEAFRIGNELVRELPAVPAVRKMAGFSAYRLGRWREALRHLHAYAELSDDPDAVPALMDAQRALGRHAKVSATWNELRRHSPDPDVLAEARIVAAGSLADRGDLRGALELLIGAGAARSLRNPPNRHVRQWYALGDLYERAGDVPQARDLFLRVARVDPEAYDVAERLDALGPVRTRPARRQRPGAGPSKGGREGTRR